jgi:hypothetical protein
MIGRKRKRLDVREWWCDIAGGLRAKEGGKSAKNEPDAEKETKNTLERVRSQGVKKNFYILSNRRILSLVQILVEHAIIIYGISILF